MNTDLHLADVSIDCVEAAKRIRKALKAQFPAVKFSVQASRYSQGSSVNVYYVDGPPRKAVESIAEQFGQRGFDGSDDSTYFVKGEVRLTSEGPATVSYGGFVFVNRKFTDLVRENAFDVDWITTAALADVKWSNEN